jgi:hypothetical protein
MRRFVTLSITFSPSLLLHVPLKRSRVPYLRGDLGALDRHPSNGEFELVSEPNLESLP